MTWGPVMGGDNHRGFVPYGPLAQTSRRRWIHIVACALVACVAMVTAYYVFAKNDQAATVPAPTAPDTKVVVGAQPSSNLTAKVLVVGDIFWGRAIERATLAAGGPDRLFRGLTTDDRASYDSWVGNLECPVTERDIPYAIQVSQLRFNCRPEFVPELAKWFTAVTLANNHTNNNGGEWGLERTRYNLDTAGIQYTGHYDMHQEADICEVITLAAHDAGGGASAMPVALCGYDYVGAVKPRQSELNQMKRYAAVMPVIALPHMGTEYRLTAEQAKVTLYHDMIDSGADMVIGAHPHVIQNSEVYKGKLIAYSVGNFLFDQQTLGRDTTLSLGVGVKLTVRDASAIAAYGAVAELCRSHKDTCAEDLAKRGSKRPAIDVSFAYECFDESSGTPMRASVEVCDDIRQRATVTVLEEAHKTL